MANMLHVRSDHTDLHPLFDDPLFSNKHIADVDDTAVILAHASPKLVMIFTFEHECRNKSSLYGI